MAKEDNGNVFLCDENVKNEENVKTIGSDSHYSAIHKYELTSILKNKLLEMPDVLEFVLKLQKCIERQRKKIRKLKEKLKKEERKDASIQTENENEEVFCKKTISEEIKEAAELAMQNTGFVYEETSGLYYDYHSGYYYNAEYGLYYDGNTGTYLSYNSEKQTYEFHSTVEVTQSVEDKYVKSKRKKDQGKPQETKRTKLKSEECDPDLEEGECSDDSCSGPKLKSGSSDDDDCDDSADVSKLWPPCMRIIIEETAVSSVKIGSLNVITCKGGTVGREGSHDILIPDINVSKHHLKLSFDNDTGKYLVTDLGSRNGTLLNGKRMASSKQESEALEVVHGSRIQVGSTVLLCHVHSGSQTCGFCEPGLLQGRNDTKLMIKKDNKVLQHKEQLKNLRKKFGVSQNDHCNANLASGYTDRAQVRRDTVGSHNDHEKTQVASLEQSISSENKGFKLLSKMGWSEGQSLGKQGKGMLEPIKLVSNPGTSGVGNTDIPINVDTIVNKAKQNIWSKAQQRYEQLKPTSDDIFTEFD